MHHKWTLNLMHIYSLYYVACDKLLNSLVPRKQSNSVEIIWKTNSKEIGKKKHLTKPKDNLSQVF